MTCFCGEITSCFTSRTLLNPKRIFYRYSKPEIENCGFLRWEDSFPGNFSTEVNLLMSKLEVATLKIENLRESLNGVNIIRDNLKKKLENFDSLNYFEMLGKTVLTASNSP
ncbi:hypothetical protein H5410_055999 [Solanum commersonii]|uniref:Zinc finger GRF-type domain-containing protein n=1 Tax=Solanum commersonii TaxID=4109 RepID=A0A9J5WJ35_SOLCO|nr:hypothetical protein H5410_055999 [Solanum commersonii]